MDVYDLITWNVSEVVAEGEVRTLADDLEGRRARVGYEPSGILHVGHMLIANELIDLQVTSFEVIILLTDVHTYLNGKSTFEEIHETAERIKTQFIVYGLDENQTEFALGSEYQLDRNYVPDLHAVGPGTALSRTGRAITEIKSGDSVTAAQVVYPIIQTLDIVYLDVGLTIGGMEQCKVHMLACDTLPSTDEESSTCMHTPLVVDPGTGISKMSSSGGITISTEDSAEDVEDKVNGAFYLPMANPEPADEDEERENPVPQIFEYHVFPCLERAVVERPEQYGGNLDYDDYETLEADLESGEPHPAGAKGVLAGYLDKLIESGYAKITE